MRVATKYPSASGNISGLCKISLMGDAMLLKLAYGGQERHRRGSAQAIRRRGFASSRRAVHDGDTAGAQSRRRQRFAAGNGAACVPLLSSIRERDELSRVDADDTVQQFSQRLSQISREQPASSAEEFERKVEGESLRTDPAGSNPEAMLSGQGMEGEVEAALGGLAGGIPRSDSAGRRRRTQLSGGFGGSEHTDRYGKIASVTWTCDAARYVNKLCQGARNNTVLTPEAECRLEWSEPETIIVDCDTYIDNYLSAHVDGELSAEELREAEEHLAGCVNCRARFAEERAVKTLLRERAAMRRTPPMVRGSILAALDAIDSADASRPRDAGAIAPPVPIAPVASRCAARGYGCRSQSPRSRSSRS